MIFLSKQKEIDLVTEKDVFRNNHLMLGPYSYIVTPSYITTSAGEGTWFLTCPGDDNRVIFHLLKILDPAAWLATKGISIAANGRFPYLTKENLVKTINLLNTELKKHGY